MEIPLKPDNETARLDTLHSLNILDTACEERFDRVTRLAKRLFDVPIAVITLVGQEDVIPKSCAGAVMSPVSRDISLCAHTILSDDIHIVGIELHLLSPEENSCFVSIHFIYGPDSLGASDRLDSCW